MLGAIALVCAVPGVSRTEAAPQVQKAVLVLQAVRQEGPAAVALDTMLRRVLTTGLGGQLDYYAEHLDFARVPSPDFPAAFADFLRRKYADKTFDAVVALSPQVLDFLSGAGADLFPGVPVVYYASEPTRTRSRTTGIVAPLDLKRTIDVALQLHPDLQQVFVVSGASEFDRFYRELAHTQLRAFDGRLAFTFVTGLSMPDLLHRVAHVPDRSVIYFLTVQEDADGNKFVGSESFEQIAAVANRPIYGWIDLMVGRGAVGGSVLSIELLADAVAGLALRVLKGESPERLPVLHIDANVYAFDWRQLQRFDINEADLPAGSLVQFRQPGLWEQYKTYLIGGATLLVLQTAMIGALVVQRVRRRRAEVALHDSQQRYRATAEQNQDLAGRLIHAQEDERARIARDLHDDVSQQVAGVAIMLSSLKRKVRQLALQEDVETTVASLQDRTAGVANAMRNLSHRLHPGMLQHAGVVQTLQRHCAEIEQYSPVKVMFTADAPDALTLSPDVSLCLFRVAQEALSNAVRHSRGGTIRVALVMTIAQVELRVADDGIGFVASERVNTGLGLRSMSERVRLLRGDVTVDSVPGEGTTVLVHIPAVLASGATQILTPSSPALPH